MRKIEKKGAMELSISTIVIIVIALTMLILGIVLVRSIMCSAIKLTAQTGDAAQAEVNKLFEANGGEIQCIGNEGAPVTLTPGKTNIISCGIRADVQAEYEITLKEIWSLEKNAITTSQFNNWVKTDKWKGPVAPNDKLAKKVVILELPKDAPIVSIMMQVIAKREGVVISTQDLNFKISDLGIIRAAMC